MAVRGPGSDPARRAASVFVGRRHERAELEAGLVAAMAGDGGFYLVTGDPGSGKSRLVEELAAAARGRALVLWGSCREESGAPDFWPWVQVLEACARSQAVDSLETTGAGAAFLAELVPSLRGPSAPIGRGARVESDDLRFYLFDSIARVLRAASGRAALLVVLDDLHAADLPSLLLLQFVAAELKDAALMIVGTWRDLPSAPEGRRAVLHAELARRARRIRLGGLRREEVGELLEVTLGCHPAEEVVDRIHRATDGNPFFVDEVGRQLLADGALGAAGDLRALHVPPSVRALIRERLGPLAPRARRVLAVAAVAGHCVDLGLLELASGLSRASLLEAIGDARSHGLLAEDPETLGRYRFPHGLVRDTLYEDLDEPQRVRLHLRVATSLERLHRTSLDAHLAEIAHHHARAALGGEAHRAVEYSLRAGRRAAALLAWETAAAHAEQGLQALALAHRGNDRARCELLLLLGEAAARAGELERAAATNREAAELARRLGWPEAEAEAALALGGPWVEIGSVNTALVRSLEGALERLPADDAPLRARVLARLARELHWSRESDRVTAYAEEAVAMAHRLDDAAALAAALTARVYSLWRPDTLEERIGVEREIVRLADDAGDAELALRGHLWLLSDLLEFGDAEGLDIEMARYERLAAQVRQPSYAWYVPRNRAMRALLRGDFAEAERLGAEAHALGLRAHPGLAEQARGVLGVVLRWERGALDGLLEGLEVFRRRYPDVAAWECGQAFLYGETGDARNAQRAVASLGDRLASLPHDANWLLCVSLLALASAEVGDRARSAQLYAALLPHRARNVTMGRALICFGSTSHFLGVLATVLGDWTAAEAHFAEALAIHERFSARPWAARTRARLARMLAARAAPGDLERAVALFEESLRAAEELGMERLAERTRGRRAELLARRAAPATPKPPAPAEALSAVFRHDGDFWAVGIGGDLFRLRDSKGIRCIVHLLKHPHHAFSALELDAAAGKFAAALGVAPALPPSAGHGAEPLLDAAARAAYRDHLRHLHGELEQASERNDIGVAERLRAEIDAVTSELGRALGLGGRARELGSPHERARINVTKQVKAAIRRIAAVSPLLAGALERAIRTGRLCSYEPDPLAPIDWQL